MPCDYDTDPARFAANLAFRARPGPGRPGVFSAARLGPAGRPGRSACRYG
jgi:hypothetical protein